MNPRGWLNNLRFVWFGAAILIPLTCALLAAIGFLFTAQQLAIRLFLSLFVLGTAVIATSMITRWAMLHRRRLRIEQARNRSQGESVLSVGEISIEQEETPEELRTQMQQTRRLNQTVMATLCVIGLSMIWSDMVPALDFLDRFSLGTSTTTVTENVLSDNGTPTTATRVVKDLITPVDIIVAILILAVTVLAVQNFPGLLEFSLLRRLPIDQSIRYAVTSLVTYAIVLIGVILACRRIGLHWEQIQWMATALTFGLAFGLQEMFANFIAGIIILFEQPVRVGDVVEIDGVAGVVTKIRIRATTITNWDRKDYIVPNKEFITGKLLNWTRSDQNHARCDHRWCGVWE